MADLIPDPLRAARLVLSLRRKGVTDDGVLTALETVDRGVFVAPHLAKMVAEDCALPIPCGQSIPRPIVTAKLLRALQISPGKEERVLLIGSGSGYTAALLSQICRPSRDHLASREVSFNLVFEIQFRAGQVMRRLINAIRQDIQTFHRSGNPRKPLHIIIPRLEISVANGPIYTMAIFFVGGEVDLRHPIALARPHD